MMYLPLEANIVGGFAHTHYNYHLKACPEIRKNVQNFIEKLGKMCCQDRKDGNFTNLPLYLARKTKELL